MVISQTNRPASADPTKSKGREFQAVVTKDGEIIPEEIYFDELNKKFTSDYLDKYSLKHISNFDDLRREISENAQKYQEQQQEKKFHFSQSDSKNSKRLVAKKLQVKPFLYDKDGHLVGEQEDYFKDVWVEVDDPSKGDPNQVKQALPLTNRQIGLNRRPIW